MAEMGLSIRRGTRAAKTGCRFFAVGVVLGLLLAVTGPAYGLTISPLNGRQVVVAGAEAHYDVETDFTVDATESLTTDPFVETAMASAATDGSVGSAFASQSSEVGAETVRGFGTSNASSVALGVGANAESAGETLYLLEFEVDATASFQLDLQLTVANDQNFLTIASFTFLDDGLSTFFEERQLSGSEQASLVGDLEPGHVYQIMAIARSESLTPVASVLSSTGVAGFDFSLVVPEAATGLLLGLALLSLSTARRHS